MNTNTKQVIFRLPDHKFTLLESRLKEIGMKRQQFLERAVDDFLRFDNTDDLKRQLLNDDDFVLQLATKVENLLE